MPVGLRAVFLMRQQPAYLTANGSKSVALMALRPSILRVLHTLLNQPKEIANRYVKNSAERAE
jgi:hypothetical protein